MERKPRHPSERPIRRDERKQLGFVRRPYEEPLAPGLRRASSIEAIGFTARLSQQDDD